VEKGKGDGFMQRKARVEDVLSIQKLINDYAKADKMLPRSLNEIYENIRDYTIIEVGGKIIACTALHVLWEDLAEIKSLAVDELETKQGYGSSLVQLCLKEAQELGVKKVFALTYIPEFFVKRFGFKEVEKDKLPRKVWSECIRCVKFPDCKEVPVVIEIATTNKHK